MSRAIHSDAHIADDNSFDTVDDGAEALLRRWTEGAQDELPDDDEEENREDRDDDETDEEEDSEETLEDSDEDGESDDEAEDDEDDQDNDDKDNKKKKVLDDDAVTKLTVDGKEVEVKVKDLKRLYGQEAALTRKSQEVAELRRRNEEQGARYVAASEQLLTRAQQRFQPYAQIDWALAVKELDSESYKALRDEATRAYEDVQFYTQELDGFMAKANEQKHVELITEAKATLKELSDPAKGIPGFSEALYDEMRSFAINQGVPTHVVDTIVSAPIIRLMHKAYLYEKGQKASTKVVDKKAKKIIKTRSSSEESRKAFTPKKDGEIAKRFKQSGSQEDAMELLMKRWASDE